LARVYCGGELPHLALGCTDRLGQRRRKLRRPEPVVPDLALFVGIRDRAPSSACMASKAPAIGTAIRAKKPSSKRIREISSVTPSGATTQRCRR